MAVRMTGKGQEDAQVCDCEAHDQSKDQRINAVRKKVQKAEEQKKKAEAPKQMYVDQFHSVWADCLKTDGHSTVAQ
ncbi:hypothetical protein PINS_up023527 [Pythium insidiosum]|nr:hypothetical protein PINS_up023527 [Pythium insidiosum]